VRRYKKHYRLTNTDQPPAEENFCDENKKTLKPPPPRWWLHLIVVRRFEYASDPESYTSCSVATGRASLAGQVKG
jgi:hypothetical protein